MAINGSKILKKSSERKATWYERNRLDECQDRTIGEKP